MSADPLAVAAMLRDWLLAQPLEGYEQSLKLCRHGLLENRFLGGIAAANLPPERLRDICRALEMPSDLAALLETGFADADTVHFGFEEGRDSATFKIYLEYWRRLDAARAAGAESFELHVAFKWDARHPGRRALATYHCHPRIGSESILARAQRLFAGDASHPALTLVRDLLAVASGRGGEPPMYLEVREAGNPRASFDLNFHHAELELAAFAEPVAELARRFELPAERFESAWRRIAARRLGHLAGGTGRDGHDFLTIYYDPLT